MRKRQFIPLLLGIGFFIIERGFAWSPVMLSMAWVITLWCLGGVCIVAALWLTFISIKGGQTMSAREEKEQRDIHVTSYGQQGGITAGVVNIQAEPQPRIDLSETIHQETDAGHLYEAILTVDTRYPIPQLSVIAHAKSIQSLDVAPHAAGVFMYGHTGKREGYHFTTLQNAAGKYTIRVTTAEPEQIKIDLG